MKNFYKKLILFSTLVLFSIVFFVYLSTTETLRMPIAELTLSDELIKKNNGPDEIGEFVDKVRSNDGYTKLIIGDSVCNQMYSGLQKYNEDICIAGTNAAVNMVGQYVLLNEFLVNHPNATDVWLIIIPNSMGGFFDTHCNYEYMVMPIIEKDTLNLLDSETIDKLKEVYGGVFLNQIVVRIIDRSAPMRKLYLNLLIEYGKGYGYSRVSQISVQYIHRMADLCKKREVRFHLLPGPLNVETKATVDMVLKEFEENGLDKEYPNYEAAIKYYPNEQFMDLVHFNEEYSKQSDFNIKIKTLGDDDLLRYLKFE